MTSQLGIYLESNDKCITKRGTEDLEDGALTTPKLADNAVTTDKVADNSITSSPAKAL
jgi:hypothetical protein